MRDDVDLNINQKSHLTHEFSQVDEKSDWMEDRVAGCPLKRCGSFLRSRDMGRPISGQTLPPRRLSKSKELNKNSQLLDTTKFSPCEWKTRHLLPGFNCVWLISYRMVIDIWRDRYAAFWLPRRRRDRPVTLRLRQATGHIMSPPSISSNHNQLQELSSCLFNQFV